MTDTEAQDHLDRLADGIVSPPPPGLLGAARSARWRRARVRLAVGGSGALVVAAVAVAAIAIPSESPPQDDPVSSTPTAPAGTRWISSNGYMVAVPKSWKQTRTTCSGAVRGELPVYYLSTELDRCLYLGEQPTSVGLVPARTDDPVDLVCDPTCSQTVVDGPVQLRLRGFDSAASLRAVAATLQPLPVAWVVDSSTGVATRVPPAPDGRTVTDPDDVVGEWAVIEVLGGPVPPGAERGLQIERLTEDLDLKLRYSDGVNDISRNVEMGSDGALTGSDGSSTDVGCVGPEGSCERPSGFGVAEAVELRLTSDGDLVLVGPGETSLAVYEPAG